MNKKAATKDSCLALLFGLEVGKQRVTPKRRQISIRLHGLTSRSNESLKSNVLGTFALFYMM